MGRRLEFHPHVHLTMPGAAFDAKHGLWRSLRKTNKGGTYLFNHKALAAVFRAQAAGDLERPGPGGAAVQEKTKVRTGPGKSRRPGS